jgi:hypothetical protein
LNRFRTELSKKVEGQSLKAEERGKFVTRGRQRGERVSTPRGLCAIQAFGALNDLA